MGTHMRVLSESYPVNTNITGFGWFSKKVCVLVLWTKVVSALEGLLKSKRVLFDKGHTDTDQASIECIPSLILEGFSLSTVVCRCKLEM